MDGRAVGVGLDPTTDLRVLDGAEGGTVGVEPVRGPCGSTLPGGAPEGAWVSKILYTRSRNHCFVPGEASTPEKVSSSLSDTGDRRLEARPLEEDLLSC